MFERFLNLNFITVILGFMISLTVFATPGHVTGFGMLSCEEKFLPIDQLYTRLTSRQKSLTIVTGETAAIENLVLFSLSQLPADFSRRTTFEFTDHLIEIPNANSRTDNQPAFKDNFAAFKLPLEERIGKTQISVGLLFRDWLNQQFEDSTSKHLTVSANQLSTRQQKELLEIYNSIPEDEDFHLMLFAAHPNDLLSGFKEKTEVIHADHASSEKRGAYLRQVVQDIISPKQKIWVGRIETPNMAKGEKFAVDLTTLAQTLTRQEIEYFIMQTESYRREQQEFRPAFVEMPGIAGSVQTGPEQAGMASLENWFDIVSTGPNKNSIKLITIPFGNLNAAERQAMQKWANQLSESKDAHLYRLLILDTPQK